MSLIKNMCLTKANYNNACMNKKHCCKINDFNLKLSFYLG